MASHLQTLLVVLLATTILSLPLCTPETLTRSVYCRCRATIPAPKECATAFSHISQKQSCVDVPAFEKLSACRMIRLNPQVATAFQALQQVNIERVVRTYPSYHARMVVKDVGTMDHVRIAKLKTYNNL